jgi:hypothetical protein
MLRRGRVFRLGRAPSAESTTIVWRGKSLPHARQDRQASSVRRPLESRQRRKSPVRRCFKPRPPLERGAPVRLRLPVFHGRLTGLLSRSPPTDTRPQARAYWANAYFVESTKIASGFLARQSDFSVLSQKLRQWRAQPGARSFAFAARRRSNRSPYERRSRSARARAPTRLRLGQEKARAPERPARRRQRTTDHSKVQDSV